MASEAQLQSTAVVLDLGKAFGTVVRLKISHAAVRRSLPRVVLGAAVAARMQPRVIARRGRPEPQLVLP